MERRGGPRSWRVSLGASFFLNPPLYIREVCGLSAPGDAWRPADPWPPAFLADRLTDGERTAARNDWPGWWAEVLRHARAAAESRSQPIVGPGFDPPAFDSLGDRPELQRACRLAWGPYIRWWQMPAGGSVALEAAWSLHYGRDSVQRAVQRFEARHRRRARPFALHIELVYPETDDTHREGDGFAVLAAGWLRPRARFEDWLAERVEAMG